MCSQLIQHVNMPLEICANVFGFQCMSMRIIHWFYMGAHWTVHESLYGIYIGLLWISIRIYIDFYIILYGSAYGFICWKFNKFLYENIIIWKTHWKIIWKTYTLKFWSNNRLKYVQFCLGRKFVRNVNIWLEICVHVFQLIQNANISLEIFPIIGG